MISDQTDNTHGAKGVEYDLGPGRGSGGQQTGLGRHQASAKKVSRYNLRPRKVIRCGKNNRHSKVPDCLRRGLNVDCKLFLKPIVPLNSSSSFNCQVNVVNFNVNNSRVEKDNSMVQVPFNPELVERVPNDLLQGVTDFDTLSTDIKVLNQLCGDGSLMKFMKCSGKSCFFCPVLKPTDYFSSTVTHRLYKACNHDLPSIVNCNSSNLIYLITCNTCNIQYVGETSQKLRVRFKKHRSEIKSGGKTYLTQHFSKGRCKNSSYTVQIIDKLTENGRTEILPTHHKHLFVDPWKQSGFWLLEQYFHMD